MRIVSVVLAVACLAALMSGPALADTSQAGSSQMPSLYKRLGGYDAIAAVTDDFIGRLATDADLSRFFVGVSDNSKARIRQLVVDQICAATGGPCIYIGRGMKEAHKGLGISEKDWQTSVNLMIQTLDKFKVGQKEKDDLLAVLSSLKPDIVEVSEAQHRPTRGSQDVST